MKKSILLFLFSLICFIGVGQSRLGGLREHYEAMELNGDWDFNPNLYYWALHGGDYGASLGFFKVKFNEGKAKLGRINAIRDQEVVQQLLRKKKTQATDERLKALRDSKLQETAERSVDMVYHNYSERFEEYNTVINSYLFMAAQTGERFYDSAIQDIFSKQALLNESVAIIHRQGMDAQLENSKRAEYYEKALAEYKDCAKQAVKLANAAISASTKKSYVPIRIK